MVKLAQLFACEDRILMERLFPEIDEYTYDRLLSATNDSPHGAKANAYTKWLCQLVQDKKIDVKDLLNGENAYYIKDLVKLHQKYKNAELVKDIMAYKSFDELKNDLDKIYYSEYKSNKEIDEEAKKGVKVIYDKNNTKIIEILSYPAAVKYGYGTKWCVASKTTDFFFKDYTNTPEKHLLYTFSGDRKYGMYVQAISQHFYDNVYYDDYQYTWKNGKAELQKSDVKGIPTGNLTLKIWDEKDDLVYSARTWLESNEYYAYHIMGDDLFDENYVYDSLKEDKLDKKLFTTIYKTIVKTYLPNIQKIKK